MPLTEQDIIKWRKSREQCLIVHILIAKAAQKIGLNVWSNWESPTQSRQRRQNHGNRSTPKINKPPFDYYPVLIFNRSNAELLSITARGRVAVHRLHVSREGEFYCNGREFEFHGENAVDRLSKVFRGLI